MKHDKAALGRLGLWTFAFDGQPAGAVREAAAEIEELGYGGLWVGEGIGREATTHAQLLLSATRTLPVATGIAIMSERTPRLMAAAERTLNEAYPDRFVLGLGGHRATGQADVPGMPKANTAPAVATVGAYLDDMDAAVLIGTPPERPGRRVLAALGPRMLALAAERTWGAHTYLVTVDHTAQARETMGKDAYLSVALSVSLAPDRAQALATAHAVAAAYRIARHQMNNLRRLGFSEAELDGRGDRLVEALFALGDVDAVATRVREHLDAGADHVCLQVLTPDQDRMPLAEWRELAGLVGEFD
ncbi:TIGR03620 family F420-dependent LLM class oxidoreductase [Embleya sp. NBC_00896]|uniref:TIGR03620 family F420-dependent LLM class oxidoreductase n=1 Tax=Embleya sp. NBC_00896 TaxID=2975961 RepID=UPI00386D9E77|nr:TIGR03620 family F420-dependent LLM class oxidoreductase [Embleya sp. NBC_00896]